MSDESPPPPLRLKPRLRPESEPAPTSVPTAPPAPSTPAATEAPPPKLRIKPKLSAPEPAPEPTPPPADLPSPAPSPALVEPLTPPPEPPPAEPVTAPALSVAPAPVAPPPPPPQKAPAAEPPTATEPPKFKIKIKPRGPAASANPPGSSSPSAETASTGTPSAAPDSTSAPKRNTPPPFPVIAGAGGTTKKFPPPSRIPHVSATPATDAAEGATAQPAVAKPRRSIRQTLLIATCVILFVGAGIVYNKLTAPPPPAPPRTTAKPSPHPTAKTPPASTAKLTPSTTLNQAATVPGAAIAKAQDAVTARRTAEQSRLDSLVAGEEPADQRALRTPPPAAITPKTTPPPKPTSVFAPVTATSQLAPGVTATTTTEVGGGIASPAFRSWVANVRINGLFQGNPPRALINGRTVRVGQTVDDVLGITFDGLDIEAKTIVFRDRTGASVTRKF